MEVALFAWGDGQSALHSCAERERRYCCCTQNVCEATQEDCRHNEPPSLDVKPTNGMSLISHSPIVDPSGYR
jgi:hypothetical protein